MRKKCNKQQNEEEKSPDFKSLALDPNLTSPFSIRISRGLSLPNIKIGPHEAKEHSSCKLSLILDISLPYSPVYMLPSILLLHIIMGLQCLSTDL